MDDPKNVPPDHYYRGFPLQSEATPLRAQLWAGLVAAITVMLLAEALVALVLVQVMAFLLLALVTVALTLVLGTPLAIVLDRRTRHLPHARATLVFGLVALVGFGVWGALMGYALATWFAANPAVEVTAAVSPTAATILGAVYFGTTFAMGAVAGRFIGPALSLRRGMVRSAWIAVGVVVAAAIYFWFFTQFSIG